MKITKIGETKTVMNNSESLFNYFAWPSVARLQNGKIAVVASGYRISHICPFGKAVISYSEDDGETFTLPAPCIDTPLDDRDAGILAFGEKNVIVTSFNNTLEFQRNNYKKEHVNVAFGKKELVEGYLNVAEKFFEKSEKNEEAYLGSDFRISRDCAVTFGEIFKCPVTSPHGPTVLNNGNVLWVGRAFNAKEGEEVCAYKINDDGTCEFEGNIPTAFDEFGNLFSCEPYAVEAMDGTIICHIRAQRGSSSSEENFAFTIYQSESCDKGKTWSNPHKILDNAGGAPSHILKHSSGVLVSTYGYREVPYGIKAMFSFDNGKTWDIGYDIYVNEVSPDLGYPSSVELSDGSILTVFYAHEKFGAPATILGVKWRFEN